MEPRLFSIEQSPRVVPPWESIIDDLGRPPPERVAQVLGVSRSTVYRWHRDGSGPRVACLALFWLTRWGRSAVHTQATNDAIMAVQLARSLGEERAKLLREVDQLDREVRELTWDLVTTRRDQADRGNAATVGPSRRSTEPEDSSAAEAAPRQPAGLALDWPRLAPAPAALAIDPAGARPGSPAAPPPEAHSARCPGPGRSPQPEPSDRQEVVSWSPSVALCHHSAITSTPCESSALLCFVCDKPRGAPGGAGAARQLPPSGRDLAPDGPPAPTTAAAEHPSTAEDRPHGAQAAPVACEPRRTRAAAVALAASAPLATSEPDGAGLPEPLRGLSAAVAERSLTWGKPQTPPPRAADPPPGASVFDAIVTATTHPTTKRNPV